MTTANHQASEGSDAGIRPLMEFWSDCFGQFTEQTQALLGSFKEANDPAALRRLWLDSLSKSLDYYMRTPAFLESVRRNQEMMAQMKGVAEDCARDISRVTGIPRIPDVSGLFERLRIGQEAILARLEAIEHRLEALENKRKRTHAD